MWTHIHERRGVSPPCLPLMPTKHVEILWTKKLVFVPPHVVCDPRPEVRVQFVESLIISRRLLQ